MCNPSLHECKIVFSTFITSLRNRYQSPRVKAIRAVSLCVVLLFTAAICAHAQQLNVGNVVVATQGGYQVWDPAGSTSTPKATMNPAAIAGANTAGCAFDSTYRMRAGVVQVPDPIPNEVVKFGVPFPSAITQFLTSGVSGFPLSIVYDGHNNFFVGIPGATGTILEYDASGALQNTFSSLPVDTASFISLDISTDGKTLYYTSGGPNIQKLLLADSSTTPILVTNTATITSFSLQNNTVTFQAANSFTAGINVTINNLSNDAGTGLNAQVLTVLSTGLTPNQFEATFPFVGTVGATPQTTGTASADYTLFGIRGINGGSGGFVVAIGADIAEISTGGLVEMTYVSSPGGANNTWQSLAFAPDGTTFWAPNTANGNLIQFNLAGGETTSTIFQTGADSDGGHSGVCVVGGFSAAQPAPKEFMATLKPGTGTNSNSFQFTTPPSPTLSLGNGITGTPTATVKFNETMNFVSGSSPNVNVTAWFTEIDNSTVSAVGTSDGGITCLPVDEPTPSMGATTPKCGVVKVEYDPDSAADFTGVNLSISTTETLPPNTTAQFLRDASSVDTAYVFTDVTGGGPRGSTEFNLGEQSTVNGGNGIVPCGYGSPVISDPFAPGGTTNLKFNVATSQINCNSGTFLNSSSISPNFNPEVSVVLLDASGLTGASVDCHAQGQTTVCPSYRRVSDVPAAYAIQINTSKLATGCYVMYTFDNSNSPLMPGFSNASRTGPNTVVFQIGNAKCKALP